MSLKQIQNVTMLVNKDEMVTLPTKVNALDISSDGLSSKWLLIDILYWKNANGQIVTRPVTSQEGEFMYYGTVDGYIHTVLCSVVVGDINENPKSQFPVDFFNIKDDEDIDEFGLPKQEVRTSDIPNIDDYQYLKAKKNRTTFESVQLNKLTELMYPKIIMARDVNHIRNAVYNTQEFCLSLSLALQETVTKGENIGSGEGLVYSGLTNNTSRFGKTMQFRKLKSGKNIRISTTGDDIEISAEDGGKPPEISNNFCNLKPLKSRSYETCNMMYNDETVPQNGAYYRFAPFSGIKVRRIANNPNVNGMLFVMGQGNGLGEGMINAGRIFKGERDLILEVKTDKGTYSGIQICGNHDDKNLVGKVVTYENDTFSHVQLAIDNVSVPIDENGKATDTQNYVNDHQVYHTDVRCGEIISREV